MSKLKKRSDCKCPCHDKVTEISHCVLCCVPDDAHKVSDLHEKINEILEYSYYPILHQERPSTDFTPEIVNSCIDACIKKIEQTKLYGDDSPLIEYVAALESLKEQDK